MASRDLEIRRFFAEARRRRVLRVVGLYIIAAWVTMQVADIVSGPLQISDETLRLLLYSLVALFPVAAVFGWFYDVTPEGVVRTSAAYESDVTVSLNKVDYLIFSAATLVLAVILVYVFREGIGQRELSAPGGTHIVAVLPFVTLSKDPNDEYFGDGLSDTILNELQRIDGISLIARTSSFSFKGQDLDIRDIGNTLGASAVLEGSVQRGGDTLRIMAQLSETRGGTRLWSRTFDRPATDLFAIQDEIAAAVASALEREMNPAPGVHIERPPSGNLAAYNLYLQGRESRRRSDLEGVILAIEYFQDALAIDPDYALAWAGLGDAKVMKTYLELEILEDPTGANYIADFIAYANGAVIQHLIEQGFDGADQAVARAVGLNPSSPDIMLAQARLHARHFEFESAATVLEELLRRRPDHAAGIHLYGLVLRHLFRYTESRKSLERAYELDPLSSEVMLDLAVARLRVYDLDAAIDLMEKARSQFPHLADALHYESVWLYVFANRPDLALESAGSVPEIHLFDVIFHPLMTLGLDGPMKGITPESIPSMGEWYDLLLAFVSAPHWLARDQIADVIWAHDFMAAASAGQAKGEYYTLQPEDSEGEGRFPLTYMALAHMSIAVGETERALEEVHAAHALAFPVSDWPLNDYWISHGGEGYMDAVSHAYLLREIGEGEQANDLLQLALERVHAMEAGGFRVPALQIVEAKALYLLGRREESMVALDQAFEAGIITPVIIDMEWQAIFGDDPGAAEFKRRMDARRDKLREGIEPPDLSRILEQMRKRPDSG